LTLGCQKGYNALGEGKEACKMRFIKKKNFLDGEELLYAPKLHWMFMLKHVVLSLPFFLILFICWRLSESRKLISYAEAEVVKAGLLYTFLAALIIVLIVFLCRLFQYLCTEYGLTNKRLMIKTGVFKIKTAEIPTDRIEGIYCRQGILGRIFCYGTVTISGIGNMKPLFFMVRKPYIVRRKIVEFVEKNKLINVVHGSIPRLAPVKPPKPPKEEPPYLFGTFVRVVQ
jgi:membrane protein YdbS with pleckstrin-like domain